MNTEPVYVVTAENCEQKGGNVGCSQGGTRNVYNYKFILGGQEVTFSYQDLDSTIIQSDGKIGPEDNLFIHQKRNPHKSLSSTDFTDNGLDGIVDDSFSIFSKEEISLEGDYATQKAYESVLKNVGEYISLHPLKK